MMKKRKFGSGGMPSMKESMESGNRVSRQVGAETKKLMPATRSTRPSVGDAIASGNRMSKKNAEDMKAVKKYAKGGKVKTSSDIARNIARKKDADRKAAEIKARGPNNAYGTMEARDKVLRKVQNDIEARDRADEDAVKRKPVGVDFIYGEPATYREMSKMEKMAYDDQAKRSGYNEEGSFGRRHIVSGVKGKEVFPDARKRGIKPADVMKKGGEVKAYAKGGVTRADGCAVRGKTKGKMV